MEAEWNDGESARMGRGEVDAATFDRLGIVPFRFESKSSTIDITPFAKRLLR